MAKKRHLNKNEILNNIRKQQQIERFSSASAFTAYMVMSLYVLNDTFGFGQIRGERYTDALAELNKKFNNDEITLEEMQEYIERKMGMKVEMPEF